MRSSTQMSLHLFAFLHSLALHSPAGSSLQSSHVLKPSHTASCGMHLPLSQRNCPAAQTFRGGLEVDTQPSSSEPSAHSWSPLQRNSFGTHTELAHLNSSGEHSRAFAQPSSSE